MNKIRPLLLPLALVFGAIAIFEFGARYGASNTRAIALAGQLQNYVNMYVQAGARMDAESRNNLEVLIDNHIATASLERNAWYLRLKAEPKDSLEKILAAALSIRGDAVIEYFSQMDANSEGQSKLDPNKLAKVQRALSDAKTDLVDNASKE